MLQHAGVCHMFSWLINDQFNKNAQNKQFQNHQTYMLKTSGMWNCV
jgi:hypothetical protein